MTGNPLELFRKCCSCDFLALWILFSLLNQVALPEFVPTDSCPLSACERNSKVTCNSEMACHDLLRGGALHPGTLQIRESQNLQNRDAAAFEDLEDAPPPLPGQALVPLRRDKVREATEQQKDAQTRYVPSLGTSGSMV